MKIEVAFSLGRVPAPMCHTDVGHRSELCRVSMCCAEPGYRSEAARWHATSWPVELAFLGMSKGTAHAQDKRLTLPSASRSCLEHGRLTMQALHLPASTNGFWQRFAVDNSVSRLVRHLPVKASFRMSRGPTGLGEPCFAQTRSAPSVPRHFRGDLLQGPLVFVFCRPLDLHGRGNAQRADRLGRFPLEGRCHPGGGQGREA